MGLKQSRCGACGQLIPLKKERIKKCEVCNEEYIPRKNKLETSRFCSKKCQMVEMGNASFKSLQNKWNDENFKDAVEMALDKFVEKTPTCWNWIGKSTSSKLPYGRISFRGKTWQAHRLSFAAFKGEIPEGKLVLHTCDNPSCVNPAHLYLGTYLDNQNDKRKRNRCVGEKLTEEEVKKIKEELELHYKQISRKGPYSLLQIGKRYGVSNQTIRMIRDGTTWVGVGA